MSFREVLVLAVAVLASVWDVKKGIIPHRLTVPAVLAGVFYNLWEGSPDGLLGAALGFSLFWLPHARGLLGGGDLMLAAAFGAAGGPVYCLRALLYGSVLGSLGAAAALLRKHGLRGAGERIRLAAVRAALRSPESEGTWLPYAVFLAAGAVIALYF